MNIVNNWKFKEHVRPIIQRCVYDVPIRMWDVQQNDFVTREELANRIALAYAGTLQLGKIPINPDVILPAVQVHTKYAILSHRWQEEELVFEDMASGKAQNKKGFPKFAAFCGFAQDYGCRYVWVDTFCINKDSSTELDESIRSMYNWYQNSYVCIVYLAGDHDHFPPDGNDIRTWNDEWFHRGWTLQELLAPKRVKFFWKDWSKIDESHFDIVRTDSPETPLKTTFARSHKFTNLIAHAAGMSNNDLLYYKPTPENAHLVFQWISQRRTTRPEDLAYCVIGLLDIQLPIAYGEGEERAFYRLQMECALHSDNRSLFKWGSTVKPSKWNSMLYESPRGIFDDTGEIDALPLFTPHRNKDIPLDPSFSFTNSGLRIMMTLHKVQRVAGYSLHSWDCFVFEERDLELSASRHPLPDEVETWRLGILGVFSKTNVDKPLAFLFCEDATKTPSRYTKVQGVEILNLPPLKKLTQRPPQVVFVV